MIIEYTKNPTVNDINFITNKINQETPEYGEVFPFAFFIKSPNLKVLTNKSDGAGIIAGANGFVLYGAIYIDQLWVNKDHRSQGIARKIMDKIHEFGRLKKCKIATIQTMSFQSTQLFYEKLGYVQDFERTGYINGSKCIFMSKIL